jgi:adenine-specific DNA-methyltransferase
LTANAKDGGDRRYVLVEMADYFDTLIRPRIQRVVYATDWKDGSPVPGSPGQSHMFHYIRLESYEDALNNVRFRDLNAPLLAALHAMPDYMLHYMLDHETASSPSLLDLKQFERPFEYKLNITRHDVTEPCPADLVTTFNFLLGLRVHTLRRFQREGWPVVRVTGTSPDGRRVCVFWRDAPPLEEMEAEKDWLQAHVLPDVAYDLLYVNGESALPGALPIEPEFKRLMFEGCSTSGAGREEMA